MKTICYSIIATFVCTVFFLIPSDSYASTCAVKETIYSAPQFFLLSDSVFVGNVTSITDYGNHQWQVHFDIEKIWKGTATRQTSAVMANTLQGCGYSIAVGEKYLVYTNGSPPFINTVYSKLYSDAQDDIALFDDSKFQSAEQTKEDLNKKLEAAQGIVQSMMMDKSSHMPIVGVGVNQVNSTLDITIDSDKATLSAEQYEQDLKDTLGDIPITVEFGHPTALMPIIHSVDEQGKATPYPVMHGSNLGGVLKSPLQQFKSGIQREDVKCSDGFTLIFKFTDGTPACVKPQTKEKLLLAGWGIENFPHSHPPISVQPGIKFDCKKPMGIQMDDTYKNLNQTKAIDLAKSSQEFQVLASKYDDARFNSVWNGFLTGDPCNSYWQNVNVVFTGTRTDDQLTWNIQVTEDPSLSKILNVTEYRTGYASTGMQDPRHPVDIASILEDLSPPNPGGPKIKVTVANNNNAPVTSLKVVLHLNNDYSFDFAQVSESNPFSESTVSDSKILIGAGFVTGKTYPVTVSGVSSNVPFNFTSSYSIPFASLPESFAACHAPYDLKDGLIPVLYMPVNSTGKICVDYSNSNPPVKTGVRIFEAGHISEDSKYATLSSNSDLVPTGNSTIVYTIKTGNHAGFYGLTIFCFGMPFAIGYDGNSTFVKDDFPWIYGTYYCPAQLYNYHISGLDGIGVKYIK